MLVGGGPPLTYRLRMVSSYGRGGLNKCNMQAGGTCYICLPPPSPCMIAIWRVGGQKELLYLTFLGSPWFSASQGGRDLKTHQDYTLFAQPPFEDLCRRHQHQLVHLMLLVTGHCDFREFQAEQRVFQQNARCHVAKLIAGHIKLSISILSKLL